MNFFVFLLIWSGFWRISKGVSCPPLKPPRHGSVKCRLGNAPVRCSRPSAGVVATFRCDKFYRLDGGTDVECWLTGRWNSTTPECVSDCGRKSSSVGLIVNGISAPSGEFPWHVAIYNLVDKNYEYWCGGSIISEHAIITAAHCTWEVRTPNLTIVSGINHRDFISDQKFLQKRKARKVEMLSSYQDVNGNYNGDLAVIFLEKPFTLNHLSSPVCLDWDQQLTEKQLTPGTLGVVVGWGVTENDTLGDHLRMARLPVVSDEQCLDKVKEDFKKFVTFTSFCAGFANGTGVCNGDSGGGLVFFDQESGRWYLQGVVSVSPRREGSFLCDPNYYAVFTKVAVFSKWIQRVMKHPMSETTENKDLYFRIRKYFAEDSLEGNNIKNAFPHTKKMLEWYKLKF